MLARHTRLLSLATLLVSLAASPLLVGCSTNPATGEKGLSFFTREQEIEIGRDAAPKFEDEFGGEVQDPQLQNYVDSVGQRVAAHAERNMPYEFTLVADKTPNAFALPGGPIFITAGLMELMTTERQLAAVLAHEVGHIAAEHNTRSMSRGMVAQILAELAGTAAGDRGQTAKMATQVVTHMTQLKYSRGAEYEADALGIRYMTAAGYNPWGMVGLLERLAAKSQEGGKLGEMFSTHPLTSERIEHAEETIRDNARYNSYSQDAPDPGRDRFGQMQRRLR